jgi:hypothetical protein
MTPRQAATQLLHGEYVGQVILTKRFSVSHRFCVGLLAYGQPVDCVLLVSGHRSEDSVSCCHPLIFRAGRCARGLPA